MLGCVEFKAPGTEQYFALRGAGMTQIEEVSTLLKLRYEVLQVHLNFSLADALSTSKEPSPAAPYNSRSTATCRALSAWWYPQSWRPCTNCKPCMGLPTCTTFSKSSPLTLRTNGA